MIYWLVKVKLNHASFFDDWYIKKVISYRRHLFVYTLFDIEAHHYKTEKAALKAADNFQGIVEVI